MDQELENQYPLTSADATIIFPCFNLRNGPHKLLLLPKLKCNSGSGSVFSQIFDSGSGSKRKIQNPAGVDSGSGTTSVRCYAEAGNHCFTISGAIAIDCHHRT